MHATLFLPLLAFLAARCARADPYAQRQWTLPDYRTPYYTVYPPLDAGNATRDFVVQQVDELSGLQDYGTTYMQYRDGGGACQVNNISFFVFSDTTTMCMTTGDWVCFTSNSLATNAATNQPQQLADISASPENKCIDFTPFSEYELTENENYWTRFALWAFSDCVTVNDTFAVQFFQVERFYGWTSYFLAGSSMGQYSLDLDNNNLTVTRESQYFFMNTTYTYGSFATLTVNDTAYLYGLDEFYSDRSDLHLARVLLTGITDVSQYEFYNAATEEWESSAPYVTSRREDAAAMQSNIPLSSGSFYFSEYHNQYVFIFFSNYVDNTFRLMTSPTPWGPWNMSDDALYYATPGPNGYNYGAAAHAMYYQTDGEAAGKTVLLHYSYAGEHGTYPRAARLTFA
ncbi:uncharacterized protein V1518DRAFT_416951 [Limtongia smithiae]|uniref:uncharacterized protein n=1 Tax=Limtongia smithiae TaxID=1125753 RepID=UPI0034CD0CFB